MQASAGHCRKISRSTVSPPRSESKTPTGRVSAMHSPCNCRPRVRAFGLVEWPPMHLASLSIDDFLDRLASEEPTPGGGALAALAGAQASAMLAMVCQLTVGRPRFAAVEEQVRGLLGDLAQCRRDLLALAE